MCNEWLFSLFTWRFTCSSFVLVTWTQSNYIEGVYYLLLENVWSGLAKLRS